MLKQGRYRLRARVRTEGLTTDQGIRLRISSVATRAVDCFKQQAVAEETNSWSTDEIPFTAPVSGIYSFELAELRP